LAGSLMYFVQMHTVEKGAVLSSPSSSRAFYVTLGRTSCFTKVNLPGDAIASDTGLDHRQGITGYEAIEIQALAQLRALDLRRGPDDFLPLSVIAEELQLPPDGVSEAIRTSVGKDVLARLIRCHERSCRPDESRAAIDRYKSQVATLPGTPFFELLLLDMSTNRCIS
jgi:hypothetical protein